jgi:hypothetical protein
MGPSGFAFHSTANMKNPLPRQARFRTVSKVRATNGSR